jgi:hypothetical protein
MAKVINPGRVPFKLPTLHVVPAGGSVELSNDALRECMRSISGIVSIGDLSVEWDAEEPEPAPSPAPRSRKTAAPDPAI